MRDRNAAVSDRISGALVVEVRGELDIATVLRWTTVLEAAICELPEPHLLVLDLAALRFLSAHGSRALLEAVDKCRERGIGGCLIVTPGSVVDRVARMSGLTAAVPVYPNRLTAIAACQPIQMRWLPS